MLWKYFLLFIQLADLANGDAFEDFLNKKLENLPTWLEENLADEMSIFGSSFSSQNSWIECNVKPVNFTVNRLSDITVNGEPRVIADLPAGFCEVTLPVRINLTLMGSYEIDGFLFPNVDRIPFESLATWSAILRDSFWFPIYGAHILISRSSSMYFNFNFTGNGGSVWVRDYQIHNFLPEHASEWYHHAIQESFAYELKYNIEHELYHQINIFEAYFEETFKDITFFDIVGGQ